MPKGERISILKDQILVRAASFFSVEMMKWAYGKPVLYSPRILTTIIHRPLLFLPLTISHGPDPLSSFLPPLSSPPFPLLPPSPFRFLSRPFPFFHFLLLLAPVSPSSSSGAL